MGAILNQEVQDIGHGVQLAHTKNVDSGTFVCYISREDIGQFRFGFFFKGGPRIAQWDEELAAVRYRSPPRDHRLIAFTQATTQHKLETVEFADFKPVFVWFTPENHREFITVMGPQSASSSTRHGCRLRGYRRSDERSHHWAGPTRATVPGTGMPRLTVIACDAACILNPGCIRLFTTPDDDSR